MLIMNLVFVWVQRATDLKRSKSEKIEPKSNLKKEKKEKKVKKERKKRKTRKEQSRGITIVPAPEQQTMTKDSKDYLFPSEETSRGMLKQKETL